MNVQLLPPKMAAQFAEKAKNGLADFVNESVYDFYQGNNVITMVSLDPPTGHLRKVPMEEMKRLRDAAEKVHKARMDIAMLAATIMDV